MAGDVIAAAGRAATSQRKRASRRAFIPASRATATAFSAASRRLSATNQNQQAAGWLRSSVIAPTAMPLCPACPRCWAARDRRRALRCRSAASDFPSASTPGFSSNSTHAKSCSRETPAPGSGAARAWARGWSWPAGWPGGARCAVRFLQRDRRFLAVARQHVEAELRVEDVLRQALEREQADGLLLQFVARPACRARWPARRSGSPTLRIGSCAVQAAQEQRQRDGGRMRDHVDRCVGGIFESGTARPAGRAGGRRDVLGGVGEIDRPRLGGSPSVERLAAGLGVAGQETARASRRLSASRPADHGRLVAHAR